MASTALRVGVIAAASRVLAILIALASDALLADHEPHGALFFPTPQQPTLASFAKPSSSAFPPPLVRLRAFSRWDAAHLLHIAQSGWAEAEYRHAFFPLYPLAVRWLARALARLTSSILEEQHLVIAGIVISNAAFVVAVRCFHGLGTHVLSGRPLLARTATLLLCVSPASAFFSSIYTESPYAAASFGGMLLLERGQPWAASLAFALATGCRANGVLNALLIAWSGGAAVVAAARERRRLTKARVLLGCLTILGQVSLVVGPYVGWQVAGYLRVCREERFLQRLQRMAPSLMTMPTPTRVPRLEASSLPAGWCDSLAPDLYAHVQSAYWGAGFLRYFSLRQLPNFALAFPAIALCTSACVATFNGLGARFRHQAFAVALRRFLHEQEPHWRVQQPPGSRAARDRDGGGISHEPRSLMYTVHWAVLTLFALLFANVQITTRLVASACPIFYWWMADILLTSSQSGGGPRARWARLGILAYVIGYAVIGSALHSNFYPWT